MIDETKLKDKFKVFISQPMRGLTLDEVKYNREQAIMKISNMALASKDGKVIDLTEGE